jgi:hypothetical protein
MSIPTAVFLDTSVFDGQSYNFSSTAFSTFVPACKQRSLKLLLPDPTEREIKRHMADRSTEAIGFIEDAHRKAPFLAKWKAFPVRDLRKSDALHVARMEWGTFLQQFDVVRLSYDGIPIGRVMNWYDAADAPFGKGSKRKEFPDAFAIAILSEHAEQNNCYIAVVSQDQDMKRACDRFGSLMYFHSLPVLTELLLSAEDSRVDAVKAVLDTSGSLDKLGEAAYEASLDVSFYSDNDYSEINDSEVQNLDITDVRIVALGEHECTIAFDAVMRVEHRVRWVELSGPEGETERSGEDVKRDYDVSGTAKVSLDAKTNAILDIPFVALDNEEIRATDIPPFWDRWR